MASCRNTHTQQQHRQLLLLLLLHRSVHQLGCDIISRSHTHSLSLVRLVPLGWFLASHQGKIRRRKEEELRGAEGESGSRWTDNLVNQQLLNQLNPTTWMCLWLEEEEMESEENLLNAYLLLLLLGLHFTLVTQSSFYLYFAVFRLLCSQ